MAKIQSEELVKNIQKQQDIAAKIKELQSQERDLRASILEELFGKNNLGTLKSEVGGFMVTGTYGQTYSFSQSEIEEALEQDILSEEASDAIRVKFELDKKVYDKLSDEASAELDDYITVKPSLPSIKVVPVAKDEE